MSDKPEAKKNKWLFKKTTYVHSNWTRWSSKGKSSKEKDAMVEEMRTVIYILSKRIDKIKAASAWSKQLWEEEKRELIRKGREDKHEALKELRRQKNREKSEERQSLGVKSLRDKLATRDARLASVEAEKDELKKELRLAKQREERLRKRVDASLAQLKKKWDKRIVEKEVVPEEVKPFMKYLNKPLNERGVNAQELATKGLVFLSKHTDINATQLSVLSELNIYGTAHREALQTEVSKSTISTLVSKNLVQTERIGNKTMIFLTPKGQELVKNYIDYLSYGRLKEEEIL